MSYCIAAFLEIMAILRKNSMVVFGLVFLFMVMMFGGNTYNPDYINYSSTYHWNGMPDYEPLARILFKGARDLGIPFQMFFAMWGIVCLILIASFIQKYSSNPTLVLALYMIWPFCIDVVQIRFYMAYAIVLHAISHIIDYQVTHQKRHVVLYFVLMAVSVGFHYSAILFFVFTPLLFDVNKYKMIQGALIPLLFMIAVFSIPVLKPIIGLVIGTGKVNTWLNYRVGSLANTIRLFIVRASLIVIEIMSFFAIQNTGTSELRLDKQRSDKEETVDICLFLFSLYSMMFISMELIFDTQYERLSRLGLVLFYILMSRRTARMEQKNKTLFSGILIAYVVLYFFIMMFRNKAGEIIWLDKVLRPVFENNLFFDRFK